MKRIIWILFCMACLMQASFVLACEISPETTPVPSVFHEKPRERLAEQSPVVLQGKVLRLFKDEQTQVAIVEVNSYLKGQGSDLVEIRGLENQPIPLMNPCYDTFEWIPVSAEGQFIFYLNAGQNRRHTMIDVDWGDESTLQKVDGFISGVPQKPNPSFHFGWAGLPLMVGFGSCFLSLAMLAWVKRSHLA